MKFKIHFVLIISRLMGEVSNVAIKKVAGGCDCSLL